jgi:hypothetical protein
MNLTKLQSALTNLIGWTRAGFSKIEENKPNIRFGSFAANLTETENAKSTAPSQQDIFNSWYRFSHNSSGVFPATPSELTAWAYDSGTGTITNTTNSGTFIGMVSKEVYDNYDLQMKLSSIDVDDDNIGVLLAWYKDPDTGKEYTLSAHRSPGGLDFLYGVSYNFNQGASNGEKLVAPGNALVKWGNGAAGNLTRAAAGYAGNTPGWGGLAAQWGTDGSTRLWIERRGDIIKVKTSQWATPAVEDETTLLTVDLSSDPLLAKFRGPSSYGIVAISQQSSKWEVIDFTNAKDGIYNLASGQVWTRTGGVWTVNPALSLDSLGKNVLLVNPTTGKMFLMKDKNTIFEYLGTIIQKTA